MLADNMKTYIDGKRDGDFLRVEFPPGEAFGTVEMFGEVFTTYVGDITVETVNGKRKITLIEV